MESEHRTENRSGNFVVERLTVILQRGSSETCEDRGMRGSWRTGSSLVVGVAVWLLAACGGSSSETPPPLPPDPHAPPASVGSDAPQKRSSDRADSGAEPLAPAPATWGNTH